ncbi:MAG: nitroreductase [Spirochaetota bacterium]|nr:nitroreductase [Spirochaetota bacterium]
MEFMDVISGRKSIRKFRSDIVNCDVLESIIKNALRAPSWGNTQPWEIAVLGPDLVKKIGDEFVQEFMSGTSPNPDLEMPENWPYKYKKRYVDVGRSLFEVMKIQREDKEARMEHYLNMFRFFYAPHAVYIYMDKAINPYYGVFDLGALTNNICLTAYENGVGTCILGAVANYPDVVRKHLNISEDKNIVIGIALGYPDKENPVYGFRSVRDEGVISWHGI